MSYLKNTLMLMQKYIFSKMLYIKIGGCMSVVKIIELVGSSNKNWEDAVQDALNEASKTIEHIVGIDILGYKGEVTNNKIVKFKAHVKIAFTVQR